MTSVYALIWVIPAFCWCCELPLEDGACPLCQGEDVACTPPHECVIRNAVIADPEGCAERIDWAAIDCTGR